MSLSTPGKTNTKASPARSPLLSPKHKLTLPELSRARSGLRTALGKCVEAAMNRLDIIWTDIGLGEEQKCARTKVVFEHMQTLLDDMANEEEACRTKLKDSMTEHLTEYTKLCTELHVEMVEVSEESTLLEKEQMLRGMCTELAKEKHTRMKCLKELLSKEEQLCQVLCRPRSLPQDTASTKKDSLCPTLKQLDEWSKSVEELAKEQKQRLKELNATRKQLEAFWSELEHEPSNEFEQELMRGSPEKLQLTDTTQSRAEQLCSDCEFQVAERNQVAEDLRCRLAPLWDRLQVDENDRASFLSRHQGCKASIVQALRHEVERLEEIRRQNIGTFITSVRQEIHLLWDQCQFGSKQRQTFRPAYSDDFTEELLTLHEAELVRLKTFAADNSNLYQLVERRDKLWHRLQELVNNANNPDRLSNRGGRLLKEEKLRKQISKELPKVEKDLRIVVQDWEASNKHSFQINDARYLDSIEMQWDSHAQRKEAEKTKRLQDKKAIIEEEIKYGSRATTPLKRKCTVSSSAAPAKKRKVTATSSAAHASSGGQGRRPLGAANSAGLGAGSFKMAATVRTPVKSSVRPAVSRSGNQENHADGTYLC
ncbi:protein regulator of cytokinesis 1-like [Sycon ciliatum]|uniref:protein regulator of cytokinesis 1-like n=1 Tax=Sycon ciliatum TaxID=27933 RepID=UPI0031F641A0